MIRSVSVTNPKGEQLLLDLFAPNASGLVVKSITGLGPPKANINTTPFATSDGSLFSSSRMAERNIVITLAMLPSPSVEENRLKTYRYFPIKKPVTFAVKTDAKQAYAIGYVESNEPDIFSKEEGTTISLLCNDPYFYQVDPSYAALYFTEPIFTFPFSNNELSTKLLKFGEIHDSSITSINYQGDVDIGFVIHAVVNGTVSDFTIYNILSNETIKIYSDRIEALTGTPLQDGDEIFISTKVRERYVQLLRHGVYTNILSAMDLTSSWMQLSPGQNTFACAYTGEESALLVDFVYQNAYGGI